MQWLLPMFIYTYNKYLDILQENLSVYISLS